jgi:hypothetical protein
VSGEHGTSFQHGDTGNGFQQLNAPRLRRRIEEPKNRREVGIAASVL